MKKPTQPNMQHIVPKTAVGSQIRDAFLASVERQMSGGDLSTLELRILSYRNAK